MNQTADANPDPKSTFPDLPVINIPHGKDEIPARLLRR